MSLSEHLIHDSKKADELVAVNHEPDSVVFHLVIRLFEFVRGCKMQKVLSSSEVAPWQKPIVTVNIPSGSRPGDRIRISKGWTAPGEREGFDVIFVLLLTGFPPYSVIGNNIFLGVVVTMSARGNLPPIDIPLPSGASARITLPAGTESRCAFKYPKYGLPPRGIEHDQGDFYVTVRIRQRQNPKRKKQSNRLKVSNFSKGIKKERMTHTRGMAATNPSSLIMKSNKKHILNHIYPRASPSSNISEGVQCLCKSPDKI